MALAPYRASHFSTAQRGAKMPSFCNLTPVQLATKLGDKRMFRHVLRRNAVMQWRWGPVDRTPLVTLPELMGGR